ncbi:MAG: endonuclease [Salinivirgaceae bacterium]
MKNFLSAKYLVTVWMLLLNVTLLLGQQKSIPVGYYNGTETLSGAPLKTALYNIIKGHTIISYTGLWNAYKTTDNLVIQGTTYVFDMYSVKSDSTSAYSYTFTTDQCGNYSGEGDCYNREHSFPKSWFNDASPMYSDLFHIVPTDGYVNGRRGNFPFGEVTSPTWTSTNGSKLGSCSYPGYTGTVFEPIDEYKGDFARIYFYMATRYENVIAGWPGSDMTNSTSFPCFSTWALNMLIEWNNEDPISTKEINRNESAYLLQHNRNPFVDHPEFVAKIWGGNSPSLITDIVTQPAVPNTTDVVMVSATITDAEGIGSVVLKWGTNSGSLSNSINMTTSGSNIYTTQTAIPAQIANITVFYKIEVTDTQASVTSSTTKSYTVVPSDVTAPELGFNISNMATNIDINTQIVISSNESLFTNIAGDITETYLNDNLHCTVESGTGIEVPFQATIDNTKTQITVSFSSPLAYQTVYYFEIPGSVFEDASGNETNKYTLSFTTEVIPDAQAPILTITPPNHATNVELNATIKINSNEPLLTKTGEIINEMYLKTVIDLKLYDVNGTNLSYNAGISNNNQLITIWPSESFTNEITYFAKLNTNAFADISGNLTDSIQTSFTTKSLNDTKAPAFIAGFPKTDTITSHSFNLIVSMDEPGTIFYELKLKTESAPTIQQLLESATIELLEGYDADTISFEGLTENTAYSVYLLTQDKQAIPNTALFALKQNITTLGIAPLVLVEPENQMICKGNEVLFVTSVSGTEPLAYQWYFGETLLQDAIDDTLRISTTLDNNAGLYFCKISNNWGFVLSQNAELTFIADVFAGIDNQVSVKTTALEMDLFELLLNNPEAGGEWIDLDFSQALNGSVFSPNKADAGIYRFNYIVTNECTTDNATVTVTVESPDAIHATGLEGLMVYPNPSKGVFYIQIPNSLTNHSLHIFSPQGTLLKQMQMEKLSGKTTLDLSEFGKGIYYIKISAASKVIVKKLVID